MAKRNFVFEARMREARKDLGMTQAQLGKAAGTSKNRICHLETGYRQPGIKALLAVSEALSVSAYWLLGLSNVRRRNDKDEED